MDLFENGVLAALKKKVMNKAKDDGCSCPVCGQFVKVYKRRINSTMARGLIWANGKSPDEPWFHISSLIECISTSAGGDFAKMRYWGLVEEQYHEVGQGGRKSSGMWRITEKGRNFVNNRVCVPEYALVFDGRVLEMSKNHVDIKSCLGHKFDYNELMGE